jgi:hypothetical protein
VIVVTVEPKIHADGISSEAFVEPVDQPSHLLAGARSVAAQTCAGGATDVRTLAREGNPADEILEAARAADADLIVVGRSGKNLLARAILGSVAVRLASSLAATSSSSPDNHHGKKPNLPVECGAGRSTTPRRDGAGPSHGSHSSRCS